jgi:hypothetical protein
MWGRFGGLWLGKGDGGVGERGLGGALVGQEQRGEAAAQYFSVEKSSCMDLLFLLPSTKGQGGGVVAAVVFDQRGVRLLEW